MARTIYTDSNQVPPGAKVLGIRVRIPRILFATDEGVMDDLTLHETRVVYVELSDTEYTQVQDDQAAINAFAESIGPEVAQALGGYVKAWQP